MTLPDSCSGPLRIALLPLDERPVNTRLPQQVAAIAGATLDLPPLDLLPGLRRPGQTDSLGRWLAAEAGIAGALVVSIDMLCYGGLIASRTGDDATAEALARLELLRRIRTEHPALPIAAVSLVMRASDSYNPQEEPDYWAQHGRELHRLGVLHHRAHLGITGAEVELQQARAALPSDVLADFERRRLRNHQVNLAALSLASDGVLETLLITADDTAEHSAGSLEQLWLTQWGATLPARGEVLMYPGADEVAAILVARQITQLRGNTPRLAVVAPDPSSLDRIAKYENSPMRTAISRQIAAAGAVIDDAAPMVLLVHGPDVRRRDLCGATLAFDATDGSEAARTAHLAARLIGEGREVALADLKYSNGGDALLVDALRERELLLRLVAYGGWNTAGNALGSVVAAACAIQSGRAAGTYSADAKGRMLLHRLIEDYGYQAIVRRPYDAGMLTFDGDGAAEATAEREVGAGLSLMLKSLTGDDGIGVTGVRFPWHRSFEIDFSIDGAVS